MLCLPIRLLLKKWHRLLTLKRSGWLDMASAYSKIDSEEKDLKEIVSSQLTIWIGPLSKRLWKRCTHSPLVLGSNQISYGKKVSQRPTAVVLRNDNKGSLIRTDLPSLTRLMTWPMYLLSLTFRINARKSPCSGLWHKGSQFDPSLIRMPRGFD